ncbi:MAG: hypothetical protein E7473_01800 [Ruminococcaceae bacterium]|nr:hypothetical protein [Oscillospiraceae bacterium]
MKRILGIILAIAMLVSMIPSAFAEETTEGEELLSITFDFTKKGRSDVSVTALETINNADGVYSSTWTAYKNFPENPATPGENWAYAGSTVKEGVSSEAFIANSAYGSEGYVGAGFTRAAGQWIAFKVKVPKTTVYRLSDFTTFLYQNATPYLEVYMFPSDARFVEGNAIYGTVEAPLTEKSYAWKDASTSFADLGIEDAKLVGKGSENVAKADMHIGSVELSEQHDIALTAGEEYILLINNANYGQAITVSSVTLTEVPEDDRELEGDLNPVYNFKLSALKDSASIEKDPYLITSPDMINESNSSIWYVHSNINHKNKQIDSNEMLVCTNAPGNNAYVLKIKTDVEGIYIPTIAHSTGPNRGRLDFYTIPVSAVGDNTMDNMSSVISVLPDADKFASIDEWSEEFVNTPPDYVGNGVYLPAGENYVIMIIEEGSGETNNKNGYHYGYIKSLSLEHTAGVAITKSPKELKMGQSGTLEVRALNSKNKVLDAEIVYESSDADVLSVSGNTVTALSDGSVRVTAKAVTADATYTDYVDIEVAAVYDPKYLFVSGAILDESIKGEDGTIQFFKVTSESQLNTNVTTGIWTYKALLNFGSGALYGNCIQARALEADTGNNAIVLNAKLDKPGTYATTVEYQKSTANGTTTVYLVPKSYAEAKGWDMGDLNDVNKAKADAANAGSKAVVVAVVDMHKDSTTTSPYTGSIVNIPEKEFYIVLSVTPGCTVIESKKYFSMISSLNLTKTGSVAASSAATTLEIGEETTVSAITKDNRDNAVEATVTYENLTPEIATLDGETVTAVAEGNAIIRATATVDGVTVSDTVTITVTPKQISVGTDINGTLSVKKCNIGANVEVAAPEITGKTFRHWVLGTEANGIPVSTNASYTFKAVTNTYLTAVYSDEVAEDAKVVEFYLENGGYVGSAVANESGTVTLPDEPTLTGYEFISWMTDAETIFDANTVVTDAITKVVGTFNAATISEGVSYGDPIKNEAATAKLWKRDGKTVAYGTSYTYYVWGASTIEAVDGEKPAIPIIVLDEEVKADNARMIEYDAAGSTIIEAGIIFGNGTNMTVDSCMYKAKSKLNKTHGQFTAKPPVEEGYTTAIGYVVYVDNNKEYKVVYSE